MRSIFPGYYRLTDKEFKKLWRECDFVFDANTLLNVYRYTPDTQNKFLEVLEGLRARVWLPHQSAEEFHKLRLTVISDQANSFARIGELLDKNLQQLDGQLRQFNRHRSIRVSEILKPLHRASKRAKAVLAKFRTEPQQLNDNDDLLVRITNIFEGRVGRAYKMERLEEIYKAGDKRYKQQIPPGYMDTYKDKPKSGDMPEAESERSRRFGDLVIWFQMLDYAKGHKKPLIFVTDDSKEDWWLKQDGKILGPRPELINEMNSDAGVGFYMYSPDEFSKQALEYLKLAQQPDAIKEIREVRQTKTLYNENSMRIQGAIIRYPAQEEIGIVSIPGRDGVTMEGLHLVNTSAARIANLDQNSIILGGAAVPGQYRRIGAGYPQTLQFGGNPDVAPGVADGIVVFSPNYAPSVSGGSIPANYLAQSQFTAAVVDPQLLSDTRPRPTTNNPTQTEKLESPRVERKRKRRRNTK